MTLTAGTTLRLLHTRADNAEELGGPAIKPGACARRELIYRALHHFRRENAVNLER